MTQEDFALMQHTDRIFHQKEDVSPSNSSILSNGDSKTNACVLHTILFGNHRDRGIGCFEVEAQFDAEDCSKPCSLVKHA